MLIILTGYNSEDKQAEHLFVNLFAEENRKSPNADVNSQAQSQSQNNEQSQPLSTSRGAEPIKMPAGNVISMNLIVPVVDVLKTTS
jgi:hypothetical protein